MASQRITVVENFETLIARGGFSKDALAKAAGVNRGVIFRAINPEAYNVGGTLRKITAWSIARVYAERVGITHEAAFARLFVVTGESHRGNLAHGSVDTTPADGSVTDAATPDLVVQPRHQEPSAVRSTAPKKTAALRLDEESVAMLAALMEDEDRSSQHDMIRVLIKRAYRALIARRSASDTTHLEAPATDHSEKEPQ
jgi:hypothetical protein